MVCEAGRWSEIFDAGRSFTTIFDDKDDASRIQVIFCDTDNAFTLRTILDYADASTIQTIFDNTDDACTIQTISDYTTDDLFTNQKISDYSDDASTFQTFFDCRSISDSDDLRLCIQKTHLQFR